MYCTTCSETMKQLRSKVELHVSDQSSSKMVVVAEGLQLVIAYRC